MFLTNQKLTVLKKFPIFFIVTTFTNIKIPKAKFESDCSYKDYNQFLFVLNNYSLRRQIKRRVSSDLFSLVWNVHYMWLAGKPRSPNWSGVSWNFIKIKIKKGVQKKRKTSMRRRRVFQVALEDGQNINFALEIFDHSMVVSY